MAQNKTDACCDTCGDPFSHVLIFGESLQHLTASDILPLFKSQYPDSPVRHVMSKVRKGSAVLHFPNSDDASYFYHTYKKKELFPGIRLSEKYVTKQRPIMYKLPSQLLDSAVKAQSENSDQWKRDLMSVIALLKDEVKQHQSLMDRKRNLQHQLENLLTE